MLVRWRNSGRWVYEDCVSKNRWRSNYKSDISVKGKWDREEIRRADKGRRYFGVREGRNAEPEVTRAQKTVWFNKTVNVLKTNV